MSNSMPRLPPMPSPPPLVKWCTHPPPLEASSLPSRMRSPLAVAQEKANAAALEYQRLHDARGHRHQHGPPRCQPVRSDQAHADAATALIASTWSTLEAPISASQPDRHATMLLQEGAALLSLRAQQSPSLISRVSSPWFSTLAPVTLTECLS